MGFGIKLIDGISQANNQVFKMLAGKDVDLTEATDFGGDLADADLILVDDVSVDSGGGTQASTKKSAMSRVWTYILGKINSTLTGAVEVAADGATTISNNAVDTQHIADDAIEEEHIGAGEVKTAAIGDDQVTYAKMQNVSADERILGRVSGADGVIEELTKAQVLEMLSVADGANAYTLPEATATTKGGIELFSNTDQSIAATAVSATASRTYGLQLNSDGQGVVNVPWVDTDTTYSVQDGELSEINFTSADHTKLNGIEDEATADQSSAEILTAIEDGVDSVHYVDGSIDTAHIGDNQVTEAKLADSLLAKIDANTDKETNVVGNLTATATATSLTIETSNGDNVSLPDAIGYTAPDDQGNGRWGVMTDAQAYQINANATNLLAFTVLIPSIGTALQRTGGTMTGNLTLDSGVALSVGGHTVNDIDIDSEASDADNHLMTALAIKNRIEDYTTGTVDTSGTPVANDFARFTDADTIEGRSYTEVKTDLTLENVENKSSATIRGEIVSADIPNNAADTTGTAEQANLASLSDESTDQTCFITFASDATGYERLKTGSNLTFDSSTGTLTANYIVGKTNTFTFTQSSVSDTWIITHNLDGYPNVTVVDSGGSVVRGLVTYNTVNKLTITFFAGGAALAFSGKAYLN